ncbi:hypothetical protein AB0C24_23750 [Amycolatopsis japonica]|uniref:hypothetical protein n=1 Tax=Amycolatopsis japonica TaxID=208439 RepID=UPI0033C4F1AF
MKGQPSASLAAMAHLTGRQLERPDIHGRHRKSVSRNSATRREWRLISLVSARHADTVDHETGASSRIVSRGILAAPT